MALRLLDRIATLVKADAHGMVESLEERSLLLKQCLREAEIELGRKRAELEALRDEQKRLREGEARSEQEARALDEDVALALAGGKEDLARFAIRRLLPRRSELAALRTRLAELAADEAALAERLAEQERQLETLRTRVRVELARGAHGEICGERLVAPIVADEEVELELMRRRTAAEGGR